MTSEPYLPNVGDLIDRGKYRIDARIGEGGMGVVFAATHMQMGGMRRAIKWLHPKLARDQNAVRRFLAEANITARIEHPNIVRPIDVSVDTDAPYIVMELLEGETLDQYLRDQALPLEKAGRIFMPILQGVAAAHDLSIVHRDLKPGNIFLARRGGSGRIPMVLDFGIAKVLDTPNTQGTLTDHGALLGTIQYMSPEQLTDASSVGPPTDVYALGMILYRMLTGRLAYEGNVFDLALRIREGRPTRLSALVSELPDGFEEVALRALAPSLEQRYPDARSFGRALAPYFPQLEMDFSRELRPSTAHPISELPPAVGARGVGSGRGTRPREPVKPEREVSTFHPVATQRAPSGARRTRLVLGALALSAAIGVALYLWTAESDERADADPNAADDRPAKPAPGDRTQAAAGQLPAQAPILTKPDAGHAPAQSTGWVQPAQPPPPPLDLSPAPPAGARAGARSGPPTTKRNEHTPRPRKPPKAPASAGTPATSPLDTILGESTKQVDSILEAKPPAR